MVPSPTPFCPASSSSSKRKLRGITGENRIEEVWKRGLPIYIYPHKYQPTMPMARTVQSMHWQRSTEMVILVLVRNIYVHFFILWKSYKMGWLPAPPAVVAILPPLGCPGLKAVAEQWWALLLLGRTHPTQTRKGRPLRTLKIIREGVNNLFTESESEGGGRLCVGRTDSVRRFLTPSLTCCTCTHLYTKELGFKVNAIYFWNANSIETQ